MATSPRIILNKPLHIIIKGNERRTQGIVLKNPIPNRHQSFYTDHDLANVVPHSRLIQLRLILIRDDDMDPLLRNLVLL